MCVHAAVIPLASLVFLLPLHVLNRRDMDDDAAARRRRSRLMRKFAKIVLFSLFLL